MWAGPGRRDGFWGLMRLILLSLLSPDLNPPTIPAKAGIQINAPWIPAFAGMTGVGRMGTG